MWKSRLCLELYPAKNLFGEPIIKPFKRCQHLLQHAFNMRLTLCWTKCRGRLNGSFNIVESAKIFGSLLEACWIKFKLVQTFIQYPYNISMFLCSVENDEWCWSRLNTPFNTCPTFVKRLFNECWSNVETVYTGLWAQILVPSRYFWRRKGPLFTRVKNVWSRHWPPFFELMILSHSRGKQINLKHVHFNWIETTQWMKWTEIDMLYIDDYK